MGGRLSKITYSIGARISLTMIGLAVFILVFAILLYLGWQTAVERTLPPPQQERLKKLLDEQFELYHQSALRTGWLPANDTLIIVIILAVACLTGVALAFWVARRISGPLKLITTTAGRVAQGDFSARVELPQSERVDETTVLAQNFNLMAESLERLDAERRFTSAAIAHELRTPLTVLRGKLEGIRYGVTEPSEAELDGMLGQIDVLTRLVNDLRTLSLAEAGKLSLHKEPADLALTVGEVVISFQTRAVAKGVGLSLESSSVPLPVSLDRERFFQVVGNLLENALRHTPPGGAISLSLARSSDGALLTVRDSGPGIPEADLPHVFERFYRSEKSRGREGGGSGLGLAIVRALVHLHGGRVAARNTPQGGALLEVWLPL
ncbi:MAG: ATP-binding protein [Meiothermus sp.]|nr:ATP-binding protein [Meiothermus sp.]